MNPPSTDAHGPLIVGGEAVEPGTRRRIEPFVARLATQTPLNLPIEVVRGEQPGPAVWLSAAIHGDELNGVEIIRQVLDVVRPETLKGTVVAVPVVNVFSFIQGSRYLPDRRDLNRHFPGSKRGSLASRLAWLFMSEVVKHCTHGLDFHTGSNDRTNLPQVRGNFDDPETRRCAEAFAAPIMLDGKGPPKSLRNAAARKGKAVLIYEAGEPQRFNEGAIELGVDGTLRVLDVLGMIDRPAPARASLEASRRSWVRAPRSGLLRLSVGLGEWVVKKQPLGVIRDVFGDSAAELRASADGIVIGHTNDPLVGQGDGVVHIARDAVAPPSAETVPSA